MTTIKQKIMVLATMMVMLVSSMVSAYGPEYWNGDTNYPRAYAKEFMTAYVDLSSAYRIDEEAGITLKYNIIITQDGKEETDIKLMTVFLKGTEDGYDRYRINPDGSMTELSNVGYLSLGLRSSILVSNYFHIKG